MSDGLEGYDGDPGLKLRGGQWVSPQELREAQIASWDSTSTAAEKLRQMEAGRAARAALGPVPPLSRRGRYILAGLALLVLLPLWALTAAEGVIDVFKLVGPLPPTTQFKVMPMASWQEQQAPVAELKRQREAVLSDLTAEVGQLYKPGTQLAGMFSHCAAKPCVRPDYSAYAAYKRHAVHPASYESDLCRALVPARLPDAAHLKRQTWTLSLSFDGEARCELVDAVQVAQAYRDQMVMLAAAGGGGIALLGLGLAMRRRRSRAAGPASSGAA